MHYFIILTAKSQQFQYKNNKYCNFILRPDMQFFAKDKNCRKSSEFKYLRMSVRIRWPLFSVFSRSYPGNALELLHKIAFRRVTTLLSYLT